MELKNNNLFQNESTFPSKDPFVNRELLMRHVVFFEYSKEAVDDRADLVELVRAILRNVGM